MPGISWSSAPSSRARRWSSASRSTSVSSATSAAAAAMPALCTLAPPSRRSVSCASSITCARPARIAPIGAQRPLFRLTATVFAGAASSAHRDAERDRGVEEPRPVEMDVGAVALRRRGQLGRQLRRQDGAARPRVRVLEHEHQRAGLDDQLLHLRRVEPSVLRPERARLEAGDLLDPHRLRGEDVRGGLQDDGASRAARSSAARPGWPSRRSAPRAPPPCRAGAATRSCSSLTEGSSPNVAQPSSADRIASHISSVGGASTSERRSIGVESPAQQVPARAARPCARRRRRRGRR